MVITVGVAEDNPSLRFPIIEYLETFGYRCVELHTKQEILAALRSNDVDVVILDYIMANGKFFCSPNASCGECIGHTPTIMVSGFSHERIRTSNHGCIVLDESAFLSKPFDLSRLRLEIIRNVRSRRADEAATDID